MIVVDHITEGNEDATLDMKRAGHEAGWTSKAPTDVH